MSAASGGCSEPKQGQRSQSARGFCPRSTMRVPQPDIIEHFGNADAVPQLPERCLSRKAGIVRCCLRTKKGETVVEILTHAGCFIGIILLGWALRRVGFFKESDFHVLSKIVIKITLTAAIVTNFSGREMQTSMLLLTLMGFGFGVLMMIVGSVMYLPQGRERQAFAMLNASGCNIGNFAMPFAQGFLGPVGVIAVSLFDCGNSMICLGGAYSIASIVKSGDGKFRIKPILNNLVHSIPLMTYIFMTILGLLHLSLPAPVVEFAGIVGNANAFMAMLMIGVGFHLNGDPSQIGDIIKILGVRYIIGIALALAAYFILPLPLEYRQALVIVFLAPVASANPPFTAQMGSDFGLASAINSVSIIASIVLITTALVIML